MRRHKKTLSISKDKAAYAHRKISGNLVLKGTLILTVTGFATRFIGFYNRIFLSSLIGARELGIYQLIFPLYMVAFALTTMGNELALTKLVSEYVGRNDVKSARAFFKACFIINLAMGIIAALFFYYNADFLSVKILNADSCGSCLKVISTAIPFMAMKGAIHGYFLGLERSEVHGLSDFIEQISKIGGLYIISTFLIANETFTASFAVIGIVIGEIVSFFYSVIMLLIHIHKTHADSGQRAIHRSKIVSLFLKNSIPLTANRFALTILQSAEAILIPTFLLKYYNDSAVSLSTYGIFTGMAFPFIMFPATLTNSLSTMLLPAVSGASSELKTDYLSRITERSIRFCLLVGLFSGVTFYIFGNTLGSLFFHNKEAGIFLYQLSFLCPVIYLATTLASILNGLGLAAHNLMLTVLSTGVRLGFILFAIPRIGIAGYASGLLVSYVFLTFASLHKLKGLVSFELNLFRDLISPFAFFTATCFLAFVMYREIQVPHPLQIPFLFVTLAVYGIICFLTYFCTL